MLMQVLRLFPCYNLSTIQDVPYCHFLVLFSMAERMDMLNTLTILSADDAKYNKDFMARLQQLERSKFKSDEVFKKVVTEDAKKRAEMFAKSKVI